jgi:hypothetical protein
MQLAVLLLVLASDGASPAGDAAACPARAEVTVPLRHQLKGDCYATLSESDALRLNGLRVRFRVSLEGSFSYGQEPDAIWWRNGTFERSLSWMPGKKPAWIKDKARPELFTVEGKLEFYKTQSGTWNAFLDDAVLLSVP